MDTKDETEGVETETERGPLGRLFDFIMDEKFLIAAGVALVKMALEVSVDRAKAIEKLHADTRARVFVIETLLEAEGIIKAEPDAEPDAEPTELEKLADEAAQSTRDRSAQYAVDEAARLEAERALERDGFDPNSAGT